MTSATSDPREPRRAPSWSFVWLVATPFLASAAIWEFLVYVVRVDAVFLPDLFGMPETLWKMFTDENIVGDLATSGVRVLGGFALAVALATPLGIWMGHQRRVGEVLAPFLGFIRYMPVPVFIPLTLLWFGPGDTQKMAIIFLGAFFQMTLMIRDAAEAVAPEYFEAAIMLGAPRRDLVLRVLWPAALPRIFDSYRICMGWAWTYLIVAEIVGATTGIGYYIIKAQRYLLVPNVFAAMFLIGLLGMCTDLAMAKLHQWLFPWTAGADKRDSG
jgi:NitT/TauT family transport system permease protein